ncbi:MAG: protein TolQ [Oceanococcus sp.]
MSFSHLILNASLLVQVVMGLLLLASVGSWFVIIRKKALIDSMRKAADRFEDSFWSGGRLTDIADTLRRRNKTSMGLEALFQAGYEEFERSRSDGVAREDILGAAQRAVRVAHMREIDRLDGGLAALATVGSTSPYVGLFGTVWGIMNAFIGLGNAKHATLTMVAPGIAEALIATAMGLVAAIPAVVAYNTFTSQVERLESRFQAFAEEFIGIVERGLHKPSE